MAVRKYGEKRMECVAATGEEKNLTDNQVVMGDGSGQVSMQNSRIVFKGKRNIVYLENGVRMQDCRIVLEGSDSVVYLCKSRHTYLLNLTLYHHSAFYMGEDNYINGRLNMILSEQKHIVIGDGGLFSFGIWMRLADPNV